MRLEREARRASRLFGLGAILEAVAALQEIAQGASVDVVKVAGCVLAIPVSLVMMRRWCQRADWFADTGEWWTRLDEAPPVLPFPGVARWLDTMTWKRLAVALAGWTALVGAGGYLARMLLH